jgi:hypothetical protein
MLGKDLSFYKEDKDDELYYQLAMQTFTAYERIANKLSHQEDYFVRNKKSVKQLIFKSLGAKKQKVEVLYALTPSNIILLELDNPYFSDIMREQIQLVDENRLELSYLFVITDKQLIDDKVIQRLIDLEKYMAFKIVENNRPYYEEIIYAHDEKFIIYQTFNDVGNYVNISKHTKDRIDINREYQLLYSDAVSLNEFIEQQHPLNGTWYSYSFSSNMDNENHHAVEFEINNNSIVGNFSSGIYRGTLHSCKDYTLLLLDNSVIKIQNLNLNDKIFRTSIIGKEQNIHHQDVLLFGIMSKKKLENNDICKLLNAILKKETEDFRLKVCDSFDRFLAQFNV